MEQSCDSFAIKHKKQHHPSFFQIYLEEHNPASLPSLGIPPPYMTNFKGFIPEQISLKSLSGRVWPAKLDYIEKKLHITDGWNRYVKDHKLKPGDFVVLTYVPNATFLIAAYGSDALSKQDPREKTSYKSATAGTEVEKRFNMTFRHRNFVCVPKHILDVCAFTLPQPIKLSNEKGDGILTQLRDQIDRVVVGYKGLAHFWKTNGVQDDDKLEFEIICGKWNQIEEIRMKNITQSQKLGRNY